MNKIGPCFPENGAPLAKGVACNACFKLPFK